MERRAKIIATVGPASEDSPTLTRLLEAGADAIRFNLSHGSHDGHRKTLRTVRRAARRLKRHLPVLMDLQGPRHRLGALEGERRLTEGEVVSLGKGGQGVDLPIEPPGLLRHLAAGERILIADGQVELRVEERARGRVRARVVTGGPVSSRKGINLPETDLPFVISAKDRADIAFAVAEGADYLAASYVGRARDLAAVAEAVARAGGSLPLVAKLERARAVDHLAEIVDAADALMVARGDLGVEVPLHRVPILQKQIVEAGRRAGKPVIVATQMLESMVKNPRPTRAEASDVANAVFDGADALLLTGETAAGKHPVEAVATMCRIIETAEDWWRQTQEAFQRAPVPLSREGAARLRPEPPGAGVQGEAPLEIPDVVAASAVFAARQLRVRQIVAFSQGGFTARLIARYRPVAPILVFTTDAGVARQIQLVWGVRSHVRQADVRHHDEVVQVVDRHLLAAGLAEPGETILILMGDPIRERPLTNLMRVHRVRER